MREVEKERENERDREREREKSPLGGNLECLPLAPYRADKVRLDFKLSSF